MNIIAEGRHVRLVHRNGWEYAERVGVSGVVLIVAVNEDRELILVEQHRPPVDTSVIELPAGLAGDIPGEEDEALSRAASRELVEETGYEATEIKWLADAPPTAGMCSETATYFHATGLRRVGPGGGDDSEDITVHHVPLTSLRSWLKERQEEGRLVATSVFAGLFLAGIGCNE